MKKTLIALTCAISLSYAIDYDPVKGSMLSLSCASCHGTDGKSVAITPLIAGLGKTTMYNILLDYKYDRRPGTMMPKHAKGFTDAELEQISYYFSKIKR
ncbi:c-type cytochrome [Campylobacterota bacterium DY0563]|uniref:c-type cytochrome n=1 Tax=Halarcobacter sp. TaxID=2321133 RepID=UPI0029F55BE0|nr:c-type cytochrome [Halarcobacter sp.]